MKMLLFVMNLWKFLQKEFQAPCTTLISKEWQVHILRLLGLNEFILTSDKAVIVNLKCDLIFVNETKVSMITDW